MMAVNVDDAEVGLIAKLNDPDFGAEVRHTQFAHAIFDEHAEEVMRQMAEDHESLKEKDFPLKRKGQTKGHIWGEGRAYVAGRGKFTIFGAAPNCQVKFQCTVAGGKRSNFIDIHPRMCEVNGKRMIIDVEKFEFENEESAHNFVGFIDFLREQCDYRNGVRDTLPRMRFNSH